MRRIVVLFALALSGCPDSHGDSPDTPIVFDLDGAMFDGGVDAPAPDLVIGDPCASSAECGEGGLCLTDPTLAPGGYCSLPCPDDTCPEGSTCLNFGMGQAFCFLDCDPEATTRPCERDGYSCATNFMIVPSPVCLPGCYDATDCPTGSECDPTGGFLGSGACFDPGSMPGDACTTDEECPSGGACLTEAGSGWPSGTCAVGCDADTGAGCDGGTCIPSGGFGADLCVASCTSPTDCRPGYRCEPNSAASGGSYCAPGCATDADCATSGYVCNPGLGTCDVAFDAGQLGDACGRSGCDGGTCLSERTSGFPMGYCAFAGCTLGGTDCPTGGVCAPGAGDTNFCLDGCATDADCRTGYACRPSDYTVMDSPLACVPACTGAADCSSMMRQCNLGTGRCTTPFEAARQGEPCADATECPGGRCHDEATDGWPAGTCAAIGCRLSGTGGSADCGAGAVCVDDAVGDPEIGECLTSCTAGMSGGCRPGYACVALTMGGTEGACRPACDAMSCASGRTCDTESGLCR